jgi:hypothetical protein
LRSETLHIRLTKKESKKAEILAEKLGCSVSAVFRQGMNRLYDEIFKENEPHVKG